MKQDTPREDLRAEIEMLGDDAFTRRKDRFKRIRTVLQFLVIAVCLAMLADLFFHLKTYHHMMRRHLPIAARTLDSLPSRTLALTALAIHRL